MYINNFNFNRLLYYPTICIFMICYVKKNKYGLCLQGIYRALGLKTDKNLFSNFPKKFFYGTYKMRLYYEKDNIVYGCITFVIEVKRPWETN